MSAEHFKSAVSLFEGRLPNHTLLLEFIDLGEEVSLEVSVLILQFEELSFQLSPGLRGLIEEVVDLLNLLLSLIVLGHHLDVLDKGIVLGLLLLESLDSLLVEVELLLHFSLSIGDGDDADESLSPGVEVDESAVDFVAGLGLISEVFAKVVELLLQGIGVLFGDQ